MICFEKAKPQDAPALLDMIESVPAKGNIRMLYTRRPNPIESYKCESEDVSIGVLRAENGLPIMMGATVYRNYYINENIAKAGYIGGIKRKAGVYPRGNWMRALRKFESEKCNDFFCSVLAGNEEAEKMLAKNRAYMPPFTQVCDYSTFLLNPKAITIPKSKMRNLANLDVVQPHDMPELLKFLNREGQKYSYYPVITNIESQFSGVKLEDMFLLRCSGEIVAFGLLWNQSHYRQNIVTSYGGIMRIVQRISPIVAAGGYIPVPQPGDQADFWVWGLLTVKNNDREIYLQLLSGLAKVSKQRGLTTAVLGAVHEGVLYSIIKRFRHLSFDSKIFSVQERIDLKTIPDKERSIHLEVGWL